MQSNPEPPTFAYLRAQAASLDVDPTDADLAAVVGFLETILPVLREIEAGLRPQTAPVVPCHPARETA